MCAAALSVVVAGSLVLACRGDRPEVERDIERAYAAYEAVVAVMNDADDCAEGVAAALSEIERRRPALERAFAIQRDPERLAAARPALEARRERFVDISTRLDIALTRCQATPGIGAVSDALEP